jgi:hypothetical protein
LFTPSQSLEQKITTTDPQHPNPALQPPSIHNTSIIVSASPTIPTTDNIHLEPSNQVTKDMIDDRSDLPSDPPLIIASITKLVFDTDIAKTDT